MERCCPSRSALRENDLSAALRKARSNEPRIQGSVITFTPTRAEHPDCDPFNEHRRARGACGAVHVHAGQCRPGARLSRRAGWTQTVERTDAAVKAIGRQG